MANKLLTPDEISKRVVDSVKESATQAFPHCPAQQNAFVATCLQMLHRSLSQSHIPTRKE